MAISHTESRIPGGFTTENAKVLGFATEVTNDFCLISFLPQNLRFGEAFQTLFNNYVVFADADAPQIAANPNFTYAWKIDYLDSAEATIQSYTEARPEYLVGSYWFRMNDQELVLADLPDLKKLRVTCTVTQGGSNTNLTLTHNIEASYDDILDLFMEDEEGQINAKAGNPAITHYAANIYREFIPDPPKWGDKVPDVPMNIPVSILYSRILKFHFNLSPNRFEYENALNNDDLIWSNNSDRNQVGMCGIKPYFLAMMLEKIPFQRLGDGVKEEDIFNAYLALDNNDKVDIFNYARFPRSNILLAAYMVSELMGKAIDNDFDNYKGSDADRNAWKGLTVKDDAGKIIGGIKESMAYEKNFVRNLLTEFCNGPQQSINGFSYRGLGRPPKHDWASYVINILQQSYVNILFEWIKIKVLDIRSGEPIERAKLKKLRIVYSQQREGGIESVVIEEEFEDDLLLNDDHLLEEDDDLLDVPSQIRLAQRALIKLTDPDDAVPEIIVGDWDDTHTSRANKFLKERKLDEIVTLEEGLNNESVTENYTFILQYLIDEHNQHGFTDEEGILNIKIPENILDRSYVHLELGFDEFTITPERIDSSTPATWFPVARNFTHSLEGSYKPNNGHTNFEVSWLGGDLNNQEIDWDRTTDSISQNLDSYADAENTIHFGWQVRNSYNLSQSYLTVCTRLIIKNDDFQPFEHLDTSLFSLFYKEILQPYHFVLFGMVWCQPLVDGIDDDFDEPHRSNRRVFRNRLNADGNWTENLGMHIVTKHVGSSNYRYGYFDRMNSESEAGGQLGGHNYRGRPHDSSDIYSGAIGIGVTNCFACHGGKFTNGYDSDDYGPNNVFIDFKNPYSFNANDSYKRFRYMHLGNREALNNETVLAGTIIGQTGREGNFENASPSHLHLELLNKGQSAKSSSMEPNRYLANHDPANAICLPGNDLPLLLPCAGYYGYAVGHDKNPVGCDFTESNIVKTCWAVQKFPDYDSHDNREFPNEEFPERVITNNVHMFACPFIHFPHPVSVDVFSVQAHLKFAFVNKGLGTIPNLEYYDPGGIDNSIGGAPNNELINLQPGDVVNILDTDDVRRQIQIQKDEVSGWLLNLNAFINGDTMQVAMQNIASNKITFGTRLAVGIFRALTPDLNFDLNDYASNFEIDVNFATNLSELMDNYNDV